MRMLDLFSGIGGFHKGFEQAGYEFDWVGFSEIDKYASAVYRHRFPEAVELGDITAIQPGDLPKSTLSLLDHLAKILVSLENVLGQKKEREVLLSGKQLDSSLSANHVFLSGKMLKERSPQTLAQTFGQLSKPLPTLGAIDLNGNLLTHAGFYPKIESGYTLSDILETEVDQKYFLSEKMVEHITSIKPGQNQKPNYVRQSPPEKVEEKKTTS